MSAVPARWGKVTMALRWSPEWPTAVVVALAWVVLVAGLGGHGAEVQSGHEHHHHAHGGLVAALPGWSLMTVAMMLPITLPAVRHVGLNSIRRRRQWAMALFAGAYVAVWIAFGLVVIAGYRLVGASLMLDDRTLLTLALALAATWQLTRAKRRAVLACKRTVPLPPVGWQADLGCVRFAVAQALRCVRSCWALMFVMAVVGHASPVWMAVLAGLIWVEELTVAGRRLLRRFAAVLGIMALLVAVGV